MPDRYRQPWIRIQIRRRRARTSWRKFGDLLRRGPAPHSARAASTASRPAKTPRTRHRARSAALRPKLRRTRTAVGAPERHDFLEWKSPNPLPLNYFPADPLLRYAPIARRTHLISPIYRPSTMQSRNRTKRGLGVGFT